MEYRATLKGYDGLEGLVQVLWNFDARTGSPANEAISTLLTALDGASTVEVHRYSADIRVACWVIGMNFFMADLVPALHHDREVPLALGHPDLVPEITWGGWTPPVGFTLDEPR